MASEVDFFDLFDSVEPLPNLPITSESLALVQRCINLTSTPNRLALVNLNYVQPAPSLVLLGGKKAKEKEGKKKKNKEDKKKKDKEDKKKKKDKDKKKKDKKKDKDKKKKKDKKTKDKKHKKEDEDKEKAKKKKKKNKEKKQKKEDEEKRKKKQEKEARKRAKKEAKRAQKEAAKRAEQERLTTDVVTPDSGASRAASATPPRVAKTLYIFPMVARATAQIPTQMVSLQEYADFLREESLNTPRAPPRPAIVHRFRPMHREVNEDSSCSALGLKCLLV